MMLVQVRASALAALALAAISLAACMPGAKPAAPTPTPTSRPIVISSTPTPANR
ncbi:MAG: hypothetical protein KGJ86_10155 [Chloroflexota bacterium]|nr:hypothetical protein [Chloroflexota bacterium]